MFNQDTINHYKEIILERLRNGPCKLYDLAVAIEEVRGNYGYTSLLEALKQLKKGYLIKQVPWFKENYEPDLPRYTLTTAF